MNGSEVLAGLSALGAAYVVGVGHGRWKAWTWDYRMQRWATRVLEAHDRGKAGRHG